MTKNWQIKKLGEVCETTSGGTPSRRNNDFYNGEIPWVKSGELSKGIIYDTEEKITAEAIKKSSAKIFPKGTLLIALYGATIGKLAFLGIEAATNQAVCGIFRNEQIDSDYLYYFLFHNKQKLVDQGVGGAQPNISQSILKNLDIPIPDLPTQHTIVAKIEELFSALDKSVDELKTSQEQLKVYRQSVLKWAFEGRFGFGDRAPDAVKEGELPKGWESFFVGEIAIKVTDGEHSTPKRTNKGIYLLSARNIQNGYLALDDVDFIPQEEFDRIVKRCNPEEGDILVSCSGSIGRVCRVPNGIKFGMVRSVALIKLDWNAYCSKYFEYLFQSPKLQKQIEKGKKATAQANLFLGPIKNLEIIVCTLAEQYHIVQEIERRLSVADKMDESLSASLLQAEQLRQSILKKAFSGELV